MGWGQGPQSLAVLKCSLSHRGAGGKLWWEEGRPKARGRPAASLAVPCFLEQHLFSTSGTHTWWSPTSFLEAG